MSSEHMLLSIARCNASSTSTYVTVRTVLTKRVVQLERLSCVKQRARQFENPFPSAAERIAYRYAVAS